MHVQVIDFVWCLVTVFIVGALCGMLVAWKRYCNVLEDRAAEMKRHTEMVAGYMTKGVDFNQQILNVLQVQGAMPRTVIIDWTLLTQAANGAGFTLVKANPAVTEKMH